MKEAFTEIALGSITLRNRFVKAATYEGMTPAGKATARLTEFHRRIAEGGTALTTVAYGAVSDAGRTHVDQLLLDIHSRTELRKLTRAVHSANGKASVQLTHCGYFSRNRQIRGLPGGPGWNFNAYGFASGKPIGRPLRQSEIGQIIRQFATACEMAVECGFDAVEIHMGHGYLLSQFLTPAVNRRRDRYGGSPENRLRLPLEVLRACRQALAPDFPILVKMNLHDGFRNGVNVSTSVRIAEALEANGASALVLSGGYTSKTPFFLMRGDVPRKGMIAVESNQLQKAAIAIFGRFVMRPVDFTENYFLDMAKEIRSSVNIPLVYLGGAVSGRGITRILASGFDFVGLGRALVHDPGFVQKLQANHEHRSGCNHCNECMVEMDKSGLRCVLTGD